MAKGCSVVLLAVLLAVEDTSGGWAGGKTGCGIICTVCTESSRFFNHPLIVQMMCLIDLQMATRLLLGAQLRFVSLCAGLVIFAVEFLCAVELFHSSKPTEKSDLN